jgi:segregation and condensation protein A
MSQPTENEIFEIALPQFKGPFDLLLFFIERDELDIYDIPIHNITADFLGYIHKMREFNMEVASEFILVAATLMKIKAQMLLPRKQLDEEGNEIDPRKELIQKILEYKQYKEISEYLHNLEEIQHQKIKRPAALTEIKEIADLHRTELEMESLNVSKLFKVFEKLLQQKRIREDDTTHEIAYTKYSIVEEKERIKAKLAQRDKIEFEELFSEIETRLHAIYHFLSILELVQESQVVLIIGEGMNNFWISLKDLDETEPTV